MVFSLSILILSDTFFFFGLGLEMVCLGFDLGLFSVNTVLTTPLHYCKSHSWRFLQSELLVWLSLQQVQLMVIVSH